MNGIYFCEGFDFSNKENIGILTKVNEQISCLKNIGELKIINCVFKKNIFVTKIMTSPIRVVRVNPNLSSKNPPVEVPNVIEKLKINPINMP